jgi:hypothetical protein
MSIANRLLVWSETNTSLGGGHTLKERDDEVASYVLLMQPFLHIPNPTVPALRDNLFPLSHGLARHTRVIAANIAALGACEELLGCRGYVGETCIVHGLSQA